MDLQLFGLFFGGISLVVFLIFALVFGIIGWSLVKQWRRHRANSAAPVQTFPVRVVTKRDHTSGGGGRNSSARTRYYVTFERPDQRRLELPVSGEEFGMLVEGDSGMLTHQGTWFQGFERG